MTSAAHHLQSITHVTWLDTGTESINRFNASRNLPALLSNYFKNLPSRTHLRVTLYGKIEIAAADTKRFDVSMLLEHHYRPKPLFINFFFYTYRLLIFWFWWWWCRMQLRSSFGKAFSRKKRDSGVSRSNSIGSARVDTSMSHTWSMPTISDPKCVGQRYANAQNHYAIYCISVRIQFSINK